MKKGIASARSKLRGAGETLLEELGLAKSRLEDAATKAMTWLGDAWRSGRAQEALGDLAGVAGTMLEKLSGGGETLISRAGDMLKGLGDALGSPDALAKLEAFRALPPASPKS